MTPHPGGGEETGTPPTAPAGIGHILSAGARGFGGRSLAFTGIALLEIGIALGLSFGASALTDWVAGADTSTAFGQRPDARRLVDIVLFAEHLLALLLVLWFTTQRAKIALDAADGRRFGSPGALRAFPSFLLWSTAVFAPLAVALLVWTPSGVTSTLAMVRSVLVDPAGVFLDTITVYRQLPFDSSLVPMVLLGFVWIGMLGFGPLVVVDRAHNPLGRNFAFILSSPLAYATVAAVTLGAVWILHRGLARVLAHGGGTLAFVLSGFKASFPRDPEWAMLGTTLVLLVAIQLVYDLALCFLAVAYRGRVPAVSGEAATAAAPIDFEAAARIDPLSVTAPLVGSTPSYGHREIMEPGRVTSPVRSAPLPDPTRPLAPPVRPTPPGPPRPLPTPPARPVPPVGQ